MIGSAMLHAGVMGWPVAHSRSPEIHGYWLKKYGIQGSYERVPSDPSDFETDVHRLRDSGWRGVNVTIPHKEAALSLADEATPRARAIGAANTITFSRSGRILADNTDAFGFIENLKERAGASWRREAPAIVLGAGGAARAVVHALLESGARTVTLANRTQSRAEALATAFGPPARAVEWAGIGEALAGAGLIVNTTSAGMDGRPPLDIDFAAAPADVIVTDIVYTPLITPFLDAATARGLIAIDGLGMLLHQARPGFEAWFGVAPQVDETLRALMLAP
ncbi:shikimate dehydrogenase [Pikeienuella piscinae]|uniref:Shikimate dehydrogenase (NADP(+)) n=1 Tax=Pikeienuella piscinae TaxID=2748098 RepID=A0A7L5C1E2_9RHOB|nr:shikimate dehydrogenase [Pikeienuella piscinae]QIE56296.1 shikimate dehydrogenase [Pikeienuella piscinae]